MLNEAVNRKIIKTNPAAPVKKLKNDRKAIEIITPAEVRLLFPRNWKTVWGNDRISYMGNKLAACTGMRAGEIMGLRGEYVYDEYIHVCAQHDEYGYRPTKTKEKRNIPVAPIVLNEIRQLALENNNGYVFSLDGGVTRLCQKSITRDKQRCYNEMRNEGGNMDYISGEDRSQTVLLPDSIDEYVDSNNSVRVIEAYIESLDLTDLGFANAQPHGTGRPMYNPKDMLKLYAYGYMNRIRSSRRMETETKRNLEAIWLMRGLSPDHKTIARFRRDNPAALKNVFCDFVRLCIRLGLYGKELVAIDGSKFKAVNSRSRNFTKQQIENKIARITEKAEKYLAELESNDAQENTATAEKSGQEIARIIGELTKHKERYQGYAEELERTGETQKSLTDGDSRLMAANGKMEVCYNVQIAVDAENKLIAEFEATNRVNDRNFITPMTALARKTLQAEKITAVLDAGYESAQDIAAAMKSGVEVHVAGTDFDICVPDEEGEQVEITSHHNGRCVYLAERNIVLCPMGNVLPPFFYNKNRKGAGVFYSYKACQQCACKCTKNSRGRLRHKVPMPKENFSKEYNDKGLAVKQIRIKADKAIVKQRKSIAEHPFGTVKRAMEAGYYLTKGLRNVNGEFSLTFLAYNLKRAINILGCRKMMECIAQ